MLLEIAPVKRPGVQRERVESSTFSSVGYSPDTCTLELEFQGGNVYRYFTVPATIHAALMNADSKGVFFHQAIRATYPFTRV